MKYYLILAASLLFLAEVQGQFSITSYNTNNVGLPSNYLGSVTIDRHNVVWLAGTEYEEGEGGIFRYDGIDWKFMELEEDASRPGINHIFDIQFGPDDDMWVYTYGNDCRITRVDSTTQTDFTPGYIFGSEGFSHDRSVWFIDWWRGLYEYNYDSLKWIFHNNFPVGEPYSPITAFNVDSSGIFWLGIGNSNLFRYNDTIISKIELFPEYPTDWPKIPYHHFNSSAFASDGSVWFATTEGLVHWFSEDDYLFYNIENSNLPSNFITDVLIDQRGYVWFSIFQEGLGLLIEPDKNFILYNEDNSGLGENEIRAIAEDMDGNIWAATWGGGVSKVHLSSSSVHSVRPYNRELKIFPNPVKANQELVFSHESSPQWAEVDIWSSEGILLKHFELDNSINQHTIELTGISSGCYIAIAKDLQGEQFTSRFVVIK